MYIKKMGQFYETTAHNLTLVSISTNEDTGSAQKRSFSDLKFTDPYAVLSVKFEVKPELDAGEEVKIAYDDLGFNNPLDAGKPTYGYFSVTPGKKITFRNPWIVPNLDAVRQYKLLKTSSADGTEIILTFECVKIQKSPAPPARSKIFWKDWQKFWVNGKARDLLYKGNVIQEYSLSGSTPKNVFVDATYPYFSIDSVAVFEHYDETSLANVAKNGSSGVVIKVQNNPGLPSSRLVPRSIDGNRRPYQHSLGGSEQYGGIFAPTFVLESDVAYTNDERIIGRQYESFSLGVEPLNAFTNVEVIPVNSDGEVASVDLTVVMEVSFWDYSPDEPEAADSFTAEIEYSKLEFGRSDAMEKARTHLQNVRKASKRVEEKFRQY